MKMETFELTADERGEPGKEGRPESPGNPGFREMFGQAFRSSQYAQISLKMT